MFFEDVEPQYALKPALRGKPAALDQVYLAALAEDVRGSAALMDR